MLKKILSSLTAIVMIASLNVIPVFAREDISGSLCAVGFAYMDGEGNEISEPEAGGKLMAKTTLERVTGNNLEIQYVFSIIAYLDGKIIAKASSDGVLTSDKSELEIETPYITLPEKINGIKIWSMITLPDYSAMLAPQANMESSENEITRINIAGYDLPLEQDKTEYDLTLYLKPDKFPIKAYAWAKDLSAQIQIGEIIDNNSSFKVKSVSADGNNTTEYTINLNAYKMENTSLASLSYEYTYTGEDGEVKISKEAENFSPGSDEYIIDIDESKDIIPKIKAEAFYDTSEVSITQPQTFPGNATVTVTAVNGEEKNYNIKIGRIITEKAEYLGYAAAGYSWLATTYANWFGKGEYAFRLYGDEREGYIGYKIHPQGEYTLISATLGATGVRNSLSSAAVDGDTFNIYQNSREYSGISSKWVTQGYGANLGSVMTDDEENLLASYTIKEDGQDEIYASELFSTGKYIIRKIPELNLDTSKMQIYDDGGIVIYVRSTYKLLNSSGGKVETYYVPPKALTVKYKLYAME